MTRAREIAKFVNASARLTNVPTPDLTNLSASNLTSGTIPNARYGTPTFNGSNLTNMSVASSVGSFTLDI